MIKRAIFLAVMAFSFLAPVYAEHFFSVCYVNHTKDTVNYNNDGYSRNWKSRGELVGSGSLTPDETKCFYNISDETIFSSDIITFTVNGKWFGIVHSGFSKPYMIAEDATNKKGGKLLDNTSDGRDNYQIYVHIMPEGKFILCNNHDYTDSAQIIIPRKK